MEFDNKSDSGEEFIEMAKKKRKIVAETPTDLSKSKKSPKSDKSETKKAKKRGRPSKSTKSGEKGIFLLI